MIGASGYTGSELLRILSSREDVTVVKVTANSNAGKYASELNRSLPVFQNLKYEKYNPGILKSLDVAFLSLPSGEAMNFVPDILQTGVRVIDLGGDYRLKNTEEYEEYYGKKHLSAEYLEQSVYGLPEFYRNDISDTDFVANPGCYATSVLLSLLPALKSKIAKPQGIVINSLSGVSGAGRKETHEFSFAEINENLRAYRITNHQHIPEMEQVLNYETGEDVSLTFIPHLAPMTRGIYTTIVADLNPDVSEEYAYDTYREFYKESPFVRIRANVPQVLDVVHTNFCDIHISINKKNNKLILIATIDNLIKGAAGQAVQNMNIMFGLPETTGFIRKDN